MHRSMLLTTAALIIATSTLPELSLGGDQPCVAPAGGYSCVEGAGCVACENGYCSTCGGNREDDGFLSGLGRRFRSFCFRFKRNCCCEYRYDVYADVPDCPPICDPCYGYYDTQWHNYAAEAYAPVYHGPISRREWVPTGPALEHLPPPAGSATDLEKPAAPTGKNDPF